MQEGSILDDWREVFRIVQTAEVWQTHGEWVTKHKPALGPGIRVRMDAASKVKLSAVEPKEEERKRCCSHIWQAAALQQRWALADYH